MKDWKTYAIAALAIWCAVLTFRSKTDSTSGTFATEEYARKCAIAVGCAVHGGDEKKLVEWFNEEIDGFGKPKKQAEAKRAESQTAGDNQRRGLLGHGLSLRRSPRQKTNAEIEKEEQTKREKAAKEKEYQKMMSDLKKRNIENLKKAKEEGSIHYTSRLQIEAAQLERAEKMSKEYPLNCSGEYDECTNKIERAYGREFLDDVLVYIRKQREKESAK